MEMSDLRSMWSILRNVGSFQRFLRKRSRAQRAYRRRFSRSSLLAQERYQSLLFLLGKYGFEAGGWVQEQRTSTFMLLRFMRTIFGPTCFAVILVVVLEVVEHLFLVPGSSFWRFALSLGFVHQLKLLLNHLGVTPGRMQLDSSTYVSLVSTVAQIGGVFLGLYFTAVGVVVSAVYSRVPGDVRALLVQEKTGNLYLRVVALLSAVAILLLIIHTLGFPIGILNLCLLSVLSMISIFSFIELGRRIFDFFNPAVLVAYLASDLQKSIHRATARGFQWHNPSFQHFYQNQAENLLNSYHNIVYLVTHEEHPYGKTLLALARNALALLVFYEKNKSSIPTERLWFRQTYQHPRWLTTDYSRIQLALTTGIALPPKIIPDPLWFEAAIEEIITDIMQTLLEKNDLRSAGAALDAVRQTVGVMAEHHAIEEALHLQGTLQPIMLTYALQVGGDDTQSANLVDQLRLTLGLMELSGSLLINTLLGFVRWLNKMPVAAFAHTIDHIRWNRRKAIYTTGLPRLVIKQLEYLQKGLTLEQNVEGRLVSPVWYRQQISALGLARFLAETVTRLVDTLESTYPVQTDSLLAEKHTLLAVQLIQTGLEACQKYRKHFEGAKVYMEDLTSLRRVADIPWTEIDWDTLNTRIRTVQKRLVISLGKALPTLATLPSSEQMQDYFGLAYSVLAQEAYAAMATGDETLFQQIISPVFGACLLAPGRVFELLQDIDATMRFIYSTEPIEDLLELSGYAIIFSELNGKSFWSTMKTLWNTYFAQQAVPQDEVDRIMNILQARKARVTIYPRAMVRQTWKQDLEGRLRGRGLLNDSFSYEPQARQQKWHPSAIIRALTRSGDWQLFDHPFDVFLAVYAREKNAGWHLNLPRETESFAKALQREEAKEQDEKESE
jgi:hypothetical protein